MKWFATSLGLAILASPISAACVTLDCGTHGSCIEDICDCDPGFSGDNCETDIDECIGVTCNARGTCEDRVNDYICTCNDGFSGVDCETIEHVCTGGICPINPVIDFTTDGFHSFTVKQKTAIDIMEETFNHVNRINPGTTDLVYGFTITSKHESVCDGTNIFYGYHDTTSGEHYDYVKLIFGKPVQEGSLYSCSVVVNHLLTRSQLDDASHVFLATKVPVETRVYVTRSLNEGVVKPKDDQIFYRFSLEGFSSENSIVDHKDGKMFELSIHPIHHNGEHGFNDEQCDSDPSNMLARLSFPGQCDLKRVNSVFHSDTGVYTFSYLMKQEDYHKCAKAVTVPKGGDVVYSGEFLLPVTFDPNEDCHYFQTHDSMRAYTITMDKDLVDTQTADAVATFNYAVTNIDYERCTHLTGVDAIVPKAKLTFDLQIFYSGTRIEDSVVKGIFNMALGGPAGGVVGQGGCNDGKCTYALTSYCQPIYENVDAVTGQDTCVFSSVLFKEFLATFTEEISNNGNPFPVNHAITAPTLAEFKQFPKEACFVENDKTLVEVTDAYAFEILFENGLVDSSDEVQTQEITPLLWWEPMIIKASIGTDLKIEKTVDLQITSFIVDIYEASGDKLLATQTLSRTEKEQLMGSKGTPYYEDPHFCRYTDPNDFCSAFYTPNIPLARWNDYQASVAPVPCYDIWKRRKDLTMIDLGKWFALPTTTAVRVSTTLYAEVSSCTEGADFDAEGKRRRSATTETTEYVKKSKDVFVSTTVGVTVDPETGVQITITSNGDVVPVVNVGSGTNGTVQEAESLAWIAAPIVGSIVAAILCVAVAVYVTRRRRANSSKTFTMVRGESIGHIAEGHLASSSDCD